MLDRNLKALFSVILGAMALLYVIHNIANIGPAYDFFVYTTSHADHAAYPVTLLPVPPPLLVVIAMIIVFSLEMAAGVLLVWGGVDMWRARKAGAEAFDDAKLFSKVGIGCAIANWWGMFQVVAVAGYQLWESPAGESPFYGSFFFGAMNMLVLLYLNQRD